MPPRILEGELGWNTIDARIDSLSECVRVANRQDSGYSSDREGGIRKARGGR